MKNMRVNPLPSQSLTSVIPGPTTGSRRSSGRRRRSRSRTSSTLHLEKFVLICSHTQFRIAWWSIIMFHLIVAGGIARAVYSFISTIYHPEGTTAFLVKFGVIFNPLVTYGASIAGIITVSTHLWHISRALFYSLYYKELMFQPPDEYPQISPSISRSSSMIPVRKLYKTVSVYLNTKTQQSTISIVKWGWKTIQHVWDVFMGWIMAWGIYGPYFDIAFYLREIFEIVLQTYQAHQISSLVPQKWISQVAVVIVVLNCWTTPVLYHFYRHHEASRRVMCLVVDISLDFFSSMVIPFCIYAAYREQFGSQDWYDPLWLMNAGSDLLCFHLNTWSQLATRILPNFSMLHCLSTIQPLLRRRAESVTSTLQITNSLQIPSNKSKESHKFIHSLFVAYGLGVLIVFVAAVHHAEGRVLQGCELTTRSWFTMKYPCSVLQLNCHQQNWKGSSEELTTVLEKADSQTLKVLILSHCQQLEMPTILQTFSNLVWLELYNVTLISWKETAALTASTHPRISRLFLIHVVLSEFPQGLMSIDYPLTLIDIEFTHINLIELPVYLSQIWSVSINTLLFEHCGLTTLPTELAMIDVETFSIAGNMIQSIPPAFFQNRKYTEVSIANNPISSLQITSSMTIDTFHVEMTQINSIEDIQGLVLAQGSPLCASTSNSMSSTYQIQCNPSDHGYLFPLAVHGQRRHPE